MLKNNFIQFHNFYIMSSFKAIFLGLVGLVYLTSCSNKALQLSLQPETKDAFTYRMTQNTESTVAVMGMDQQTSMEQTIDYAYAIQKVNADGSTEMTTTIKKIRMEQAMPMFAIVFDSEKPEDNNPAEMMDGLNNLIGKKFDLKVAKDGEILSAKGEEDMFKGMFENAPNGEMMEEQMKAQFGEGALATSVAQLTSFYPEEPIKVGDSWVKNTTSETMMPLEIETTYTLKERKNGEALIDFSSKLKSVSDGEAAEMMGMSMEYDMTGTQSGTIRVEEKTGWAIHSESKQLMEGKLKMSGGQIGGEMEAEMKVDSKTMYEKVD